MSVPENKADKATIDPHKLETKAPEPHKATVPPKAAGKLSVPEACADLRTRYEAALAANDKGAIEGCWKEIDELYKQHSESEHAEDSNHVLALSRLFHGLSKRPEDKA